VKVRKFNAAKLEKDEKAEKAAAMAAAGEMTDDERYSKVMDLLKKSEFYSQFLLEKIENGDNSNSLKQKKINERKMLQEKEPKTSEKEKKQSSLGRGRGSGRGRSRGVKRKVDDDIEVEASPKTGESASGGVMAGARRAPDGQILPVEQPLLLRGGVMRDYQIKGYLWMSTLYENGINGILADEMGLGKTIQTIALFCHLIELDVPGPFLIIAPLSTIRNWVREFNRFAPDVPCLVYHGDQKEREQLRKKLKSAKTIDGIRTPVRYVFVTSFEIAINDRAAFRNVSWRYIVVDEGHRLKNHNCKLVKELKMYLSVNRLLLTGTPLQNNLTELWSLLNFLMGEIFDDLRVFQSWFDAKEMDQNAEECREQIVRQEKQKNILQTLHKILTPFLLRRVKADVDLKIPPKKEVIVYCPLTPRQRELYKAVVEKTIPDLMGKNKSNIKDDDGDRTKRKRVDIDYSVFLKNEGATERELNAYLDRLETIQDEREEFRSELGKIESKNINKSRSDAEVHVGLKSRMMDLRKVTNHPYLVEYPLCEDDEGNVCYRADEDMIDICGKLQVLDQMIDELLARKHKILIFSQMTRMLDIIGDYLGQVKEVRFSRLDGSMSFEDRQENIDVFNETDDVQIFLLSTRAGGLGINLTAADTCIIYDSDWNPQQDLQAQDRCHRIGQTKPVMIYRLVTAKTIDQKIVERAAAKRRLEKMIIHSKKFKSQDSAGLRKTMEAINPQELLELLNSDDATGIVDRADARDTSGSGRGVLTNDELELLLDRSDLTWRAQKEQLASKKRKKINVEPKTGLCFTVVDDETKDNGGWVGSVN